MTADKLVRAPNSPHTKIASARRSPQGLRDHCRLARKLLAITAGKNPKGTASAVPKIPITKKTRGYNCRQEHTVKPRLLTKPAAGHRQHRYIAHVSMDPD